MPEESMYSPAFRQALGLLEKGKSVEAEETMRRAIHAAERQDGSGSPAVADAYFELASVLFASGQPHPAAAALRQACAGPYPEDPQAMRDRLTYEMNLGEALTLLGELDEAEATLRRSLEGRRLFYGANHAGYAFGLEPLADLLLRRGKPEEALPLVEETVRLFWYDGHERVTTAIALRAEILKTMGSPIRPFEGLDRLPDAIIAGIGVPLFGRIQNQEMEPTIARHVLAEFVPLCIQRLGEEHSTTLNAFALIANLERALGDHEARIAVSQRVLNIYQRLNRPHDAMLTAQGLAYAYSDAGRPDEAERAYEQALNLAQELGNPSAHSQVLRNYGLFLAEDERRNEALPILEQAVEVARSGHDLEMIGRGQVALGIFLQHGGDPAGAQSLLEEALRTLPEGHPDTFYARSHLYAMENGLDCGCNEESAEAAVTQGFRAFVLSQVPPETLKDVEARIEDGEISLHVELARELSEEEMERLNRVLQHAVAEFRQRLQRAGEPA